MRPPVEIPVDADDADKVIWKMREDYRTGAAKWIQYAYTDNRNGYCMSGYLSYATDRAKNGKAVDEAYGRIYMALGAGISWWNDRPERTLNDVLDVLERALRWRALLVTLTERRGQTPTPSTT